jgi:hypothetical protein
MTAAKLCHSRPQTGLITNQGKAEIFMQISGRDYQHNPPFNPRNCGHKPAT